ncbi:MAG: outer membrane lipoprotein carrier protein LolA [Bacteroidales bacterium]|jgi:outer membrane lipoprotein-sorting protein|nr:outer membrane lipoprotein carrier protein LolA [Bacteroidales bacterium]
MKAYILILSILLLTASSFAQSLSEQRNARRLTTAEKDKTVVAAIENKKPNTAVLENAVNKLKDPKGVEMVFRLYTSTDKSDFQLGKLLLQGNKFHIELDDFTVISDGKTLWNYLEDSDEVQISDITAGSDVNPFAIFKDFRQNFMIKYIRDVFVDQTDVEVYDLTPLSPQNFFKIRISVNKKLQILKTIEMYQTNKQVITYEIIDFKSATKILPDDFSFDVKKHKGVQVIDLR